MPPTQPLTTWEDLGTGEKVAQLLGKEPHGPPVTLVTYSESPLLFDIFFRLPGASFPPLSLIFSSVSRLPVLHVDLCLFTFFSQKEKTISCVVLRAVEGYGCGRSRTGVPSQPHREALMVADCLGDPGTDLSLVAPSGWASQAGGGRPQ